MTFLNAGACCDCPFNPSSALSLLTKIHGLRVIGLFLLILRTNQPCSLLFPRCSSLSFIDPRQLKGSEQLHYKTTLPFIPWLTYPIPNICHHPRQCMLYTRSFIHGSHRKETGKGNQVSSMSVIVGWKDISNIQSNTYAPSPPLPAHLNIGVPPCRCSVCDSLAHTLSVFVKCSRNSPAYYPPYPFCCPNIGYYFIPFQASLWLVVFFSAFPIIILMSDAWCCCFWKCFPSSSINNRQYRPHRIKDPLMNLSFTKITFQGPLGFNSTTTTDVNHFELQHTMKTENKKK